MRQYLLLVLLLSFSISESYATIYKWTNERGVITYSQHKPSNHTLKSERIVIKSTLSSAEVKEIFCAEPASQSTQQPETIAATQVSNREQQKINTEAINEICQSAQKNLVALQRSGNVLYKDAGGNFMRLTEQDKTQKRKEANQLIKEFCQ